MVRIPVIHLHLKDGSNRMHSFSRQMLSGAGRPRAFANARREFRLCEQGRDGDDHQTWRRTIRANHLR